MTLSKDSTDDLSCDLFGPDFRGLLSFRVSFFSDVNVDTDFAIPSKASISSNILPLAGDASTCALPEFIGLPRCSKGSVNTPDEVYAEEEVVSKTTKGSSGMAADGLADGTADFCWFPSGGSLEDKLKDKNNPDDNNR